MKKKVLAALIAAQMVVSLCPAGSIWAADLNSQQEIETQESTSDETDDVQSETTGSQTQTDDVEVEQTQTDELYGATDESDFKWDGNTITKYIGSETNVVIPNRATGIGYQAFYGRDDIQFVNIPESVTSIGEQAFYGCTKLTSVVIPSQVQGISREAFKNCTGLTSFEIKSPILKSTGYGIFS